MSSSLLGVFTLKALKPRVGQLTVETPKIKDGLRKIDELRSNLQKLQKLFLALTERSTAHTKEVSAVGAHLGMFMDKDRALPVPSQNPEESGFLNALQKFSELFMDVANLEVAFAHETQRVAALLQEFIDSYLTENTKTLRKIYETARTEYDKQLLKVNGLKDNKKNSVVKLYEAEKERAKLFKVLEKATRALEDHCDDLDDMINIVVAGYIVDWANALKNQLGLTYGQFNNISDYLTNLHQWCVAEEKVCKTHKTDRDTSRTEGRQQEALFLQQQFASLFTLDLIHTVLSVVQADSATMVSSFCCMFHQAGLPLPEGLDKFPGANLDTTAKAPVDVAMFIKENFDIIGAKLMESSNRDLLSALGEAVANITMEK